MNAAGFAPALILAPCAVPLARRFGKKELGIFAAALGTVAFGALFLMRTTNMWVYTIINIVGLLGFGLYTVCVCMCTDNVVRCLLGLIAYKRGKWKNIKLHNED